MPLRVLRLTEGSESRFPSSHLPEGPSSLLGSCLGVRFLPQLFVGYGSPCVCVGFFEEFLEHSVLVDQGLKVAIECVWTLLMSDMSSTLIPAKCGSVDQDSLAG